MAQRSLSKLNDLSSGIAAFVVWGQIDVRQHQVGDLHGHAGVIGDNCKAALTFSDKEDAEETLAALKKIHRFSLAMRISDLI